jgi:uncharacterized membrane protein
MGWDRHAVVLRRAAISAKQLRTFFLNAILTGFIVVVPVYLAILLLLKAIQSVAVFVRPVARLFPEWFPAENALALALVVLVCFLVGVVARTPVGRRAQDRLEKPLQRIPGYGLFRGLTERVAGESQGNEWQPALAEIEDALVPAFIIEALEDGRFTIFVPSVPTPFAGTVYVLSRERVHPLDVPFTQAIEAVARWGLGSRDLVAAMKTNQTVR